MMHFVCSSESVRSIGHWSDTLRIHISIDQNDHSFIIQFKKFCLYVTDHTGMLGGLVGSLTKVAIYPTYAICCERLWSVPAPVLGLNGIRC